MIWADAEASRVSGLAFRWTHSAMARRVDGNSNAAMNATSPQPQGTATSGTSISAPFMSSLRLLVPWRIGWHPPRDPDTPGFPVHSTPNLFPMFRPPERGAGSRVGRDPGSGAADPYAAGGVPFWQAGLEGGRAGGVSLPPP